MTGQPRTHILELRDRPSRYILRAITTSSGQSSFRLTNDPSRAYRFTPNEAADLVCLWRGQLNLIAKYRQEGKAA